MADGHQRAAWSHSIALAVHIGKFSAGPTIFDVMPERYKQTPRPKTEADERAESEHAFALLEGTIRTMHRQGKA